VLAVAAPVLPAVTAAPAGADQISDLQSQAAQIAHTLVLEQLQIGGFEQQEGVAAQQVDHDQAAIAQTQQQLTADQQRIDQDTGRVRAQALRDYMTAGSVATGTESEVFSGGGVGALARGEYEQIASGDITTAIDTLRTSRQALEAQQAALTRQQAADQAAQNQQSAALQHADATQGQLAAEQSRVKGQLAGAVAAQQAAEAAAAAAQIKASELAAAQRAQAAQAAQAGSHPAPTTAPASSSSAPTTGSGGPAAPTAGSGGATSDPPLPPFLVCVRQAESGGDYGAVSANGEYMGAFQFSQATWNEAATDAGLPGLVGVPPNTASQADQDTLAVTLYDLDGEQPWYDPCNTGS
jgi:hypothetical protein